MDKRVVSVLAAIVLALAGYLFFFERGQLTSKQRDERKGRALESFVRDRVDSLSLSHAGQSMAFERSKLADGALGAFRMTAPRAEEADENALDSFVGELEWLSARRTIDAPSAADLAMFGLDKPSYTLSYRVAGDTHTFVVGKPDVHGDSFYARLDDAPRVLLVPKTLVEALDKTPGHFRSKQFLGDIVSTWARKLSVESGGVTVTVEKENGRFWVAGEPRTFADDERVREVIKALDALRATRFLEGATLARVNVPALVPVSALTLKVVPDDAREDQQPAAFTLIVYGACPEHADERVARAGASGDLVCVLSSDVQTMLDLGDLREHHLLPVDPSEVTQLRLAGPSASVEVKRKDDTWLNAKGEPADRAAVEAWLAALRGLTGGYEGPSPFVAGEHSLTLTMADRRVALALGTTPRGELALVREGEGQKLIFAGEAGALLAAEPDRFRSLAPWDGHKPSEVSGVSARIESTSRTLTLVDGAFRTAAQGTAVADNLRIRELIRALLKWQARLYVGSASSLEQGFAKPVASLKLGLVDKTTLTMEVARNGSAGLAVRLDSRAVFHAEPLLLAQIYELAGVPVPAGLLPTPGAPAPEDEEDDDALIPGHDHDDHDEGH